jgi:hypothetical protein
MTASGATTTITNATRVKIAPSVGAGAKSIVHLKSVSGVVRIYGTGTGGGYVTFSDVDPIGKLELEPGDEIWLLGDSTSVDVQSLELGVGG